MSRQCQLRWVNFITILCKLVVWWHRFENYRGCCHWIGKKSPGCDHPHDVCSVCVCPHGFANLHGCAHSKVHSQLSRRRLRRKGSPNQLAYMEQQHHQLASLPTSWRVWRRRLPSLRELFGVRNMPGELHLSARLRKESELWLHIVRLFWMGFLIGFPVDDAGLLGEFIPAGERFFFLHFLFREQSGWEIDLMKFSAWIN